MADPSSLQSSVPQKIDQTSASLQYLSNLSQTIT